MSPMKLSSLFQIKIFGGGESAGSGRGGRVGRTPPPQAAWPPAAGTQGPGRGVGSLSAPFLSALPSIPSSQHLAVNAFLGRRLLWNWSTRFLAH